MRSGWRNLLVAVGVAALGGGASVLIGPRPAESSMFTDSAEWVLPQARSLDFGQLDARWEARPPWPAPPKAAASAVSVAIDEAPAAMPIGIARGRRGQEAIFSVPGAGELSLPVGGQLPDGGRVLQVSGLRVEWVDGKGRNQQREMFNTYQLKEVEPAPVVGSSPPESGRSTRRR